MLCIKLNSNSLFNVPSKPPQYTHFNTSIYVHEISSHDLCTNTNIRVFVKHWRNLRIKLLKKLTHLLNTNLYKNDLLIKLYHIYLMYEELSKYEGFKSSLCI
jgi:hypothetical protein